MSFLIIIGVYLFYTVEKTGQDWVNERENDRCCELFALKDGYQFVDHEEQKKYYYDKEGRVYSFFGVGASAWIIIRVKSLCQVW